jgi:LacI family transcriptional regulator
MDMKSQKRMTIADIAQKAGVSKQTVSRVINDKPDVAPETRQHIQNLIKAMGYEPDPIARSMKGRTYSLGCITPNFTDLNITSIVQAAQKSAQKQGFFTLVASAESEMDFHEILSEMINRRVDGLLVINPHDDNRHHYLRPHIENGLPIVYIKNSPVNEAVSAICLDDEQGGFIAAQHLLSFGHTAIVNILGPENEECTQKRLSGFNKALQAAGIPEDPKMIMNGDWSAESGQKAIRKLMGYNVHFSAVFAQNDWMALGAMQALKESGLKIPGEISVLGFDDLPFTAFTDPPLTTIQQPIAEFGKTAAEVLINHINQPETPPETINLEPDLVIRGSCAAFFPRQI